MTNEKTLEEEVNICPQCKKDELQEKIVEIHLKGRMSKNEQIIYECQQSCPSCGYYNEYEIYKARKLDESSYNENDH